MAVRSIRHVSAPKVRAQVVEATHWLRATTLILVFLVVLLAFSQAGMTVMSGVRHGMVP